MSEEELVIEGKMGERAAKVGNLEVSVSFGRFENDLLSWERWSSFPQNKYLEEVEKYSTPGSVAEKKAYFEAHYKKIAAKKAEIEDQQKQFEATLSMGAKNSGRSTIIKSEETDDEHMRLVEDKPVGKSLAAENFEIIDNLKQQQLDLIPGNNSGAHPIPSSRSGTANLKSSDSQTDEIQSAKEVDDLNNEPGCANLVGKANDSETGEVFQTTVTVGEKQESVSRSEAGAGAFRELEQEPRVKDSPWLVEATETNLTNLNTGKVLDSSSEEMTKLKTQNMTKVLLTNSERRVTKVKKAPLSVTPKSSQISRSTPKTMIPISTPSMMSTSRSSAVKGSISSESSIRSSYEKHKKPAPRTDTISLSSGLGSNATATRKSTLMEKMREKDIVKRVFKPFQANLNPTTSLGEQSDSLLEQVLRNAKGTKMIETLPSQKGKEWLHKTGVISANVAQTAPLVANLRTDTVTHKGKEMKKVGRNPDVKVPAGSHILAKSKEVKEPAAKDLQQSRRFKATPLPAFYRGTGVSKNLARKESPRSQSTGPAFR